MDRINCFAYKYSPKDGCYACHALNDTDCDKCKFHKTEEQIEEEKRKTKERIRSVYGVSTKTFLESKRRDNNA